MASLTRRKACDSCIKRKRRCDLRHPSCSRCTGQHIECHYQSTRLHDFPCGPSSVSASPTDPNNGVSVSLSCGLALDPPPHWLRQTTELFLTPDSWLIAPPRPGAGTYVSNNTTISNAIHTMKGWLHKWVQTQQNVFIHKALYEDRHSSWIQDAYTVCATYLCKTPDNKNMVYRIIDDHVSRLLGEHISSISSLFDHVSRVQALLVYQIIRLFDSNPRERVTGETLLPVLIDWAGQMLESARVSSEYIQRTSNGFSVSYESAWRAWFLAESVRRTWLTVVITRCIYEIFQRGYTACPGGLMFTVRSGLWEASGALPWAKTLEKENALLLSPGGVIRLFEETGCIELDDFARFTMSLTSGIEAASSYSQQEPNRHQDR